ncbi:hypothetical protein [Pseudomonas viridiflava]|uniref:hypothetical protein n=1 Tax=Pseudomonas viridiflava TaxID=33069 RepID=UPI000F03765D|nr:hypothetical protein [Pseudomonas viridiflava]
MLKGISEGKKPSHVFRDVINADPTVGNMRLSEFFHEEFIEVDSLAMQVIWSWCGPGKTSGLSDESLDEKLLDLLSDAGYL